jgi:hypothetical protein
MPAIKQPKRKTESKAKRDMCVGKKKRKKTKNRFFDLFICPGDRKTQIWIQFNLVRGERTVRSKTLIENRVFSEKYYFVFDL